MLLFLVITAFAERVGETSGRMRSDCSAMGISEPEQFHIAITGEKSVSISWATKLTASLLEVTGLHDGHIGESILQVKGEDGKIREIDPEAVHYFHKCGELQEALMLGYKCTFRDYSSPNLFHTHVEVNPGEKYEYRVANDGHHTEWRSFKAPPPVGAKAMRIAVVGDLGQTEDSHATCETLRKVHKENPIDAGVILGDLPYSDGNGTRWDTFQRMFDKKGCGDIPWMVIPGNHDVEPDDLSSEPFLPLRARWRTPEVAKGTVGTFSTSMIETEEYNYKSNYDYGGSFYGVKLGPAHFVALNPYTHSAPSSPQINWLRKELKGVNRKETPYVFALTHAPWVQSSKRHQDDMNMQILRDSAKPLLADTNVDAIFSGHVHAYDRSNPVDGTVHYVLGNGGNREGMVDFKDTLDHSAFRSNKHYGFGVLDMSQKGQQWTAYANDGSIFDKSFIPRAETPSFIQAEVGPDGGVSTLRKD